MTVPEAQIITRVCGPMANNCYALVDASASVAAIIDPGIGGAAILDDLPPGVRVEMVLLTHGHFDHLADVAEVMERTGAKLGLHPADEPIARQASGTARLFGMEVAGPPAPDFALEGDQALRLGTLDIKVLHVPGHSPGGVAFVTGQTAFTGDTLFAGSIGRTDLPGGDLQQLLASIRNQLLGLPDDTVALPGHGPDTTIGRERSGNPFLFGL